MEVEEGEEGEVKGPRLLCLTINKYSTIFYSDLDNMTQSMSLNNNFFKILRGIFFMKNEISLKHKRYKRINMKYWNCAIEGSKVKTE